MLLGNDYIVFHVVADGTDAALRLPHSRPDPLTFQARLVGADLGFKCGAGPRLLGADRTTGVMMSEWVEGESALSYKLMSNQLNRKVDLAYRLGAILNKVHSYAVPTDLPRPNLKELTYRLNVAPIFKQIAHVLVDTQMKECPSHGDLVPHNVILRENGQVLLIDWDYAALHDPCWDLAYVIQEFGLDEAESSALFKGYGLLLPPRRILLFRVLIAAINAAWRLVRGLDVREANHLVGIFSQHPIVLDALKSPNDLLG